MILTKECNSIIIKPFDIENQIWRELGLFMDFRYLRKSLKNYYKNQSIREKRIEEKAHNIQVCFKQAKDYFNSAKYATIITKPVLIYYGFVSLVTALVIFKQKDKMLNSLPESHGLSIVYPDRINDLTKSQFLKISAKINRHGLFQELIKLKLIETYSIPLYQNEIISGYKDFLQEIDFYEINENIDSFNIAELFSNIPEIWKEVRLSLKIKNNVYAGQPILYKNQMIVKISSQGGLLSDKEILENNSFLNNYELYDTTKDNYFFKLKETINQSELPLIKTNKYGENFFVADKENKIISNDLIIQYLTFFILGSIARYKPDLWQTILDDNVHGFGEIPKILCETSLSQIPLNILKELINKHINIKI